MTRLLTTALAVILAAWLAWPNADTTADAERIDSVMFAIVPASDQLPQADDDAPPVLICPPDDIEPDLQAEWVEPANPAVFHDPFWLWWMTMGVGDLDLYEEMLQRIELTAATPQKGNT